MGKFRRSRFFGSLVEPRKAREGWLPQDQFDRLCRREYVAWRLWRRVRSFLLLLLCVLGFWAVSAVSSLMKSHSPSAVTHAPHRTESHNNHRQRGADRQSVR